ncbi:hypothetical protein HMPREF0004_0807 [Achromobacter piechaudii ATCC 43553]|uniref:Uncharacterized protein n=1 Tax=Achromobacter piechaudii ATCC 43553 TaxID=742159 RepID=D4X5R0_9BURK|nr:hypothetical protein HMPREF0004_0807 [Achromobacter piechaudii ATCC 43553]
MGFRCAFRGRGATVSPAPARFDRRSEKPCWKTDGESVFQSLA